MARPPFRVPANESKRIGPLKPARGDRNNSAEEFAAVALRLRREFIVDRVAVLRTLLSEQIERSAPDLLCLALETCHHLPSKRRRAESLPPLNEPGIGSGHRHHCESR